MTQSFGRRLTLQTLEDRHLLAAVGFVAHELHRPDTPGLLGTRAADMDSDGRMDLVTAYNSDASATIVWFRNQPNGFERARPLAKAPFWFNGIAVGDIDSDGDPDVVLNGSVRDDIDNEVNTIVWFENPGSTSQPFLERPIAQHDSSFSCLASCVSIFLADLDRDGDSDLINEHGWYENVDGSGAFEPRQQIGVGDGSLVAAIDMNQDGAIDVVSKEGREIVVYENVGTNINRFERVVVASVTEVERLSEVTVHDADGDQDFDLAAFEGGTLFLFENEGTAFRKPPQTLNLDVRSFGMRGLLFVDMDGDGDQDMVLQRDGLLFENDGHGGFHDPMEIDRFRASGLADLDGDQDLDFYSQSGIYNVFWHANAGDKSIGPANYITSGHPILSMEVADFDHDGLRDVLAWGEGHLGPSGISIHRRLADQTSFMPRAISREFYSLAPLVADLNGDGFEDIVTQFSSSRISWFQNDQEGNFHNRAEIFDFGTRNYAAGDLDADGDDDLLLAGGPENDCRFDCELVLLINDDLQFQPSTVSESSPAQVLISDVDGDQDEDIVGVQADGTLTWFRNTDGRGSFVQSEFELDSGFDELHSYDTNLSAADIDGDGDDDLVLGDGKVWYWYENSDGRGDFVRRDTLDMDTGFEPTVRLADVDDDGDHDLVAAGVSSAYWLENVDGQGSFSDPIYFVKNQDFNWNRAIRGFVITDVDLDGDMDLIAGTYSGRVLWFENRPVGDSNDDGRFDSSDLVKVFQAGKYEDEITGNTTFDEGDWNLDGDFDASDLVLAFQAGHFVAAAVPPESLVGAAVDWLFARVDEAYASRA